MLGPPGIVGTGGRASAAAPSVAPVDGSSRSVTRVGRHGSAAPSRRARCAPVDTSRLKATFKRVARGARPADEQTEAHTYLLKATTSDADWAIIHTAPAPPLT